MKPPYRITGKILKLVASISERIGEVNSAHLYKPILFVASLYPNINQIKKFVPLNNKDLDIFK
jgi:hypothetical protein